MTRLIRWTALAAVLAFGTAGRATAAVTDTPANTVTPLTVRPGTGKAEVSSALDATGDGLQSTLDTTPTTVVQPRGRQRTYTRRYAPHTGIADGASCASCSAVRSMRALSTKRQYRTRHESHCWFMMMVLSCPI